MPLNLRGAGDHPEIGIRVDKKGVAFDTATGRPLARAEVDSRIASFQKANPGTEVYGLVKKRGGLARVYDNNKKVITPALEIGAGLLGGPAAAAAVGAAMKGFDRKGQGGIGFDAGQGLRGGIEGGLLGYGAGKVAGALKGGGSGLLTTRADGSVVNAFGQPRLPSTAGFGDVANAGVSNSFGAASGGGLGGALRSGMTKLGSVAKAAGSTLLGGAKELVGGPDGVASSGDWLKAGLTAIPAIQGYTRARDFEKTANTQLGNATAGNAAMADIAKALIARGSAPAAAPDLSHLVDTRNPYAKKLRPMIGAPGV